MTSDWARAHRRHRGLQLSSLALGALVAAPALAAEAPAVTTAGGVFLEWHAPEHCPTARDVYVRVRDAVDYSPEEGRFARIVGHVARQNTRWQLTLELAEGREIQRRVLLAERCDELEGAAAIAIVLALGEPPGASDAATTTAASAPPLPVSELREPSDESLDAREDEAPPADMSGAEASSDGPSWMASGQALLDLGSLGPAAAGVALDGRARWDRVEIAARALWLPPVEHRVGDEAVRFGLVAAGPRACYVVLAAVAEALACATFEAGVFLADGGDLSRARRLERPWLGAGAALELRAELAPALHALLGGELLRPIFREDYTINGAESVYHSAEVSGRLSVGIAYAPE